MEFYLAPLEGITGFVYRNALQKYFPGTDRYFTPFIVPDQNKILRTKERRDVLPENNAGIELVPQILTNSAEAFLQTVSELEKYGYREVNLNFGCPSGTVVSRKRGAGFLAYPDAVDAFLEEIFSHTKMQISIKTRLGRDTADEFYELVQIYNKYPLSELIIHPRTRVEYYRGVPHLDIFEEVLPECRASVCYNGNLLTAADYERFIARFPSVSKVMLGRGVIANPGLMRELKCKEQGVAVVKTQKEELRAFLDELKTQYRALFSEDKNTLFRMKELWVYLIHLFCDADSYAKKIRKASSLSEYEVILDGLFRNCDML